LTVDSANRRNAGKLFANGNFEVLKNDSSSAHEYDASGAAQ